MQDLFPERSCSECFATAENQLEKLYYKRLGKATVRHGASWHKSGIFIAGVVRRQAG
jgi:hypothetical protein